MKKDIKNIAASVHQRLLNRAHAEKRRFNEVLQFYAMERFLYRLSCSPHAEKFILKGALMLRVWQAPTSRPTMDIDMLGRTNNDMGSLVEIMKNVCRTPVEDDGLEFFADDAVGEEITKDGDYKGVRVRFGGVLGKARIKIQIDVGFGDVVYPGPQREGLETLLEMPKPELMCYSRESVVAEKFEAMVKLEELNSRMKDFYDIWLLGGQFEFDGSRLLEAVKRTFDNRKTVLPNQIAAFRDNFPEIKALEWKAFRRKMKEETIPADFSEVIKFIKVFLLPIIDAIRAGEEYQKIWKSGSWL